MYELRIKIFFLYIFVYKIIYKKYSKKITNKNSRMYFKISNF